jgi:hypothetical protein
MDRAAIWNGSTFWFLRWVASEHQRNVAFAHLRTRFMRAVGLRSPRSCATYVDAGATSSMISAAARIPLSAYTSSSRASALPYSLDHSASAILDRGRCSLSGSSHTTSRCRGRPTGRRPSTGGRPSLFFLPLQPCPRVGLATLFVGGSCVTFVGDGCAPERSITPCGHSLGVAPALPARAQAKSSRRNANRKTFYRKTSSAGSELHHGWSGGYLIHAGATNE